MSQQAKKIRWTGSVENRPMSEQYRNYFTIFIPTYNRAHLLPRAFASIEKQTFRDFEVLVIDDGSTDNTGEVTKKWAAAVDFPVRYYRKLNGGKPSAHNFALDKIQGCFTVTLDSDDVLAANALELLQETWEGIPAEKRENFAGVEGLCAYLDTHRIHGKPFPEEVMDSDFLEINYRIGLGGDRKNSIRTDVLKQYPFPCFVGEKDMRESVIMARMSSRYQFRYINKIIQYVEQLPDGLTAQPFSRRIGSPRGFRLSFQEMVNDHAGYCSRKNLRGFMVRYVRYSFHARIGILQQGRDIRLKGLWLLCLPEGWSGFLKDRFKLLSASKGHSKAKS